MFSIYRKRFSPKRMYRCWKTGANLDPVFRTCDPNITLTEAPSNFEAHDTFCSSRGALSTLKFSASSDKPFLRSVGGGGEGSPNFKTSMAEQLVVRSPGNQRRVRSHITLERYRVIWNNVTSYFAVTSWITEYMKVFQWVILSFKALVQLCGPKRTGMYS